MLFSAGAATLYIKHTANSSTQLQGQQHSERIFVLLGFKKTNNVSFISRLRFKADGQTHNKVFYSTVKTPQTWPSSQRQKQKIRISLVFFKCFHSWFQLIGPDCSPVIYEWGGRPYCIYRTGEEVCVWGGCKSQGPLLLLLTLDKNWNAVKVRFH